MGDRNLSCEKLPPRSYWVLNRPASATVAFACEKMRSYVFSPEKRPGPDVHSVASRAKMLTSVVAQERNISVLRSDLAHRVNTTHLEVRAPLPLNFLVHFPPFCIAQEDARSAPRCFKRPERSRLCDQLDSLPNASTPVHQIV